MGIYRCEAGTASLIVASLAPEDGPAILVSRVSLGQVPQELVGDSYRYRLNSLAINLTVPGSLFPTLVLEPPDIPATTPAVATGRFPAPACGALISRFAVYAIVVLVGGEIQS